MSPSGTIDHPAMGPVKYSITPVSDDPDTQVAQVIGMMRDYAVEDAPRVRPIANQILNSCGEPLSGVWSHVHDRMRFVRDEETAAPLQQHFSEPIVETLVRPADVGAGYVAGDCDDYTMYGASLLHSLGIPVSFCTVAADASNPYVFSHVYLVAYPNVGLYAGERVPLDMSHGPYPGVEVSKGVYRREEWPVSGGGKLVGLALAGLVAFAAWSSIKRREARPWS